MEKEALLNIISNDLKEVELLVSTFKQMGSIDTEFLQLTLNKLSNLTIEVKMLEKFSAQVEAPKVIKTDVIEDVKPIVVEEHLPTEVIKEIKEEAVVAQKESITTEIPEQKTSTTTKKEELLDLAPEEIVAPIVVTEVAPIEVVKPQKVEIEITEEKLVAIEAAVEETKSVEKNIPIKDEKAILKDVLATNKKSVNETISTSKVTSPALGQNIVVPIANIYKAIGINDKMLFQRELFENNGAKMNSTIDQLNELSKIDDALGFLRSNYNWDFESETVKSFINIIKRRYL